MTQRTVAITGGHGVLGRAVLEAALKGGWQVAVIDHASGHAVPDGVLEVGGVDLTDAGQAQKAVDAVIARFGRLDALLNIAGGFVWQTTDDAEPAWDRMHALNVATAVNASRAALDALKASPEGRIV
ncbi:SDR family NAD(P)-dependent oxidoreductase, partial [uncultured Brevundimonas sp.]